MSGDPKPDKQRTLEELRRLQFQLENAVNMLECDRLTFNVIPRDSEIHQGYEIGDFVITPRFPKTDFQG